MQLEEIALTDDYFVERKLYPNVDFYTGLIYQAMGFPTKMFTVLFALGRLPGWIAQWREMIDDPDTKIGRPRQIYTGCHRAQLRRHRRPLSAAHHPDHESRPTPRRRVGRSPCSPAVRGAGRRDPGPRQARRSTTGRRQPRACGPAATSRRSRPGCGSTCGRPR